MKPPPQPAEHYANIIPSPTPTSLERLEPESSTETQRAAMAALKARNKTKYGANAALTAVSAAAFGSLAAYVREYGTPYQSSKCQNIIEELMAMQKTQRRKPKGHKPQNLPEWGRLRQELYELAGDWLWMHATNHWRVAIAPKMQVPVALQDQALYIEPVRGDVEGTGESDVWYGWNVMHPGKTEDDAGKDRRRSSGKSGVTAKGIEKKASGTPTVEGKADVTPTRKSGRKRKPPSKNDGDDGESLYVSFADYEFGDGEADSCFDEDRNETMRVSDVLEGGIGKGKNKKGGRKKKKKKENKGSKSRGDSAVEEDKQVEDSGTVDSAPPSSQGGKHQTGPKNKPTPTVTELQTTSKVSPRTDEFPPLRKKTNQSRTSNYNYVFRRQKSLHETAATSGHEPPAPWSSQVPMRGNLSGKKTRFFVGQYHTQIEAALAADLILTFVHPENLELHQLGGEQKRILNVADPEECERFWKDYLVQTDADDQEERDLKKTLERLRTVDVVDVAMRPMLRKIVHEAVKKWPMQRFVGAIKSPVAAKAASTMMPGKPRRNLASADTESQTTKPNHGAKGVSSAIVGEVEAGDHDLTMLAVDETRSIRAGAAQILGEGPAETN